MAIEVRGMAPLVQVFDMPTSLAFYRDKLGFRITADSGQGDRSDWVMLQLGNATIMLNTAYEQDYRPEAPEPDRLAAHRDTCIYFSCPDVDAAYEHVRSNGIECKPPSVAPYGMKQLYVTDPDNYNLCFQWPAGTSDEH